MLTMDFQKRHSVAEMQQLLICNTVAQMQHVLFFRNHGGSVLKFRNHGDGVMAEFHWSMVMKWCIYMVMVESCLW